MISASIMNELVKLGDSNNPIRMSQPCFQPKNSWLAFMIPGSLPACLLEDYWSPDRAFHNLRASRSGDQSILCSSRTPCDRFWGSKIVEMFGRARRLSRHPSIRACQHCFVFFVWSYEGINLYWGDFPAINLGNRKTPAVPTTKKSVRRDRPFYEPQKICPSTNFMSSINTDQRVLRL